MEKERKNYRAHVLVLPYPAQGHINPMLTFSKRLAAKGLKVTLATTTILAKTLSSSYGPVNIHTISDGYDEGGFSQTDSAGSYLTSLETAGSKTLADLVKKHEEDLGYPIDCILYDPFMPWALDVAKRLGLVGAAFFTQPCAVNFIYYHLYHKLLKVPLSSLPVSIPGLPLLDLSDVPSFIRLPESYPAYLDMLGNQFSNIDKADCVLVNTFYHLEKSVVDSMSKVCPLLTVGPTLPSYYLDNRVENDRDYEINLFTVDGSSCTNWLSTKPKGSVVYVAFGSLVTLSEEQMVELAWGIKTSNCYFLWAVRANQEAMLSEKFRNETAEKGLLVNWSPQLEVLANEALGCFFTHCGWNSTIEALSLGVPLIAMPQWADQMTNAKLIEDVWRVGIRVKEDEKGIMGREEIESCIREVMEGERGKEMKKNARKFGELSKQAVDEGGTSDKNIDEFISKLV